MISTDTLTQVLASAMILFISLLPITFMSWRDRFLQVAINQAQMMKGLGDWMISSHNHLINFKGPFKFCNVELQVDIGQPPLSVQNVYKSLKKAVPEGEVILPGPPNPQVCIMDGYNRSFNMSVRRGLTFFIALLTFYSILLAIAVILTTSQIMLPFSSPININQFLLIELLVALVAYLAYAITMFKDSRISWHTVPVLLPNGKASDVTTDTLWNYR